MKPRLVDAAADRLASPATGPQTALDAPLTEDEVLRVLARIARTGKPGDRLRAAELIGKHFGMFREQGQAESAMTFAELVLTAQRTRELPSAATEVVKFLVQNTVSPAISKLVAYKKHKWADGALPGSRNATNLQAEVQSVFRTFKALEY